MTTCKYQHSFFKKLHAINNEYLKDSIKKILKSVDETKIDVDLRDYINQNAKSPVNIPLIKKAVDTCIKYHGTQMRKSGEPYYTHPIEVASRVMSYKFDTNVIIAALLHDTIEDTDITYEEIRSEFGERVEDLVRKVSRNRTLKDMELVGNLNPDILKRFETSEVIKLTIEELMSEMYKHGDKDAMIIKMYDRMHNLETSYEISDKKRFQQIDEVINSFMPLFEKLGSAILMTALLKAVDYAKKEKKPAIEKDSGIEKIYTTIQYMEDLIKQGKTSP